MTYKNFEDYLSWKHSEQYEGLDDEMPENYEEWLQDLDPLQWIAYGDTYALEVAKRIKEKITC